MARWLACSVQQREHLSRGRIPHTFRLYCLLILITFLLMNSGGLILMLRQTSFCLAVLKIPDLGDLMSHLIQKGQLLMMLKIREPL
jgi:hypothetical protein